MKTRNLTILLVLCALSTVASELVPYVHAHAPKEVDDSVPPELVAVKAYVTRDTKGNIISLYFYKQDITEDVARAILKLPELNTLDFSGCNLSAEMSFLQRIRTLRDLSFGGTDMSSGKLAELSKLTSLRKLRLPGTRVADDDLVHLNDLRDLEHLDLGSNLITGSGLKHLEMLQELSVLKLNATRLDDEGLKHIAKIRKLNYLDVSTSRVSGIGVELLYDLPHLSVLALNESPITRDGLEKIVGAPRLVGLGGLKSQSQSREPKSALEKWCW